jgi:NTP pyrophosphatase (non-canonical NTP hydrolase)
MMTVNRYQREALRTLNEELGPEERLQDGLMGLCGESGECIDILKKVMFQGHSLDCEKLAYELGDVAWYLAISAAALGYDLETIMQMNLDKLKIRYPEKFEARLSVERKDGM